MAGTESKSRRVTEVCSVGVTAAPIQLHPENGSSAGSPGHELHGHQFSEVRGAGKKCFSLTHKEQFVQKNIYIYIFKGICFIRHSRWRLFAWIVLQAPPLSGGDRAVGEGAFCLCPEQRKPRRQLGQRRRTRAAAPRRVPGGPGLLSQSRTLPPKDVTGPLGL